MCWCQPGVRTPNCGSMACTKAARRDALSSAVNFVRREAERMRNRNEGADAAVSAHLEIIADQLDRGEHEARR